jgi:uncharacterized protein YfbU (UPF0304 family)
MVELRTRIIKLQGLFVPLKIPAVLERAFALKTQRLDSAVAFLTRAKCRRIIDYLVNKGVTEPSKFWLNDANAFK